MRVLHCVPSMAGGGAERQLTYLVKELIQARWDVHVAVIHGGPNLARLEATGATVHRLRALGNHDPQILVGLLQTIRRVRPDVMQCWLPQMEILGGLAALVTGTPWVFSERASEEAYPRTLKMWFRAKVASRATAIVSNSEAGDQYWSVLAPHRVRRYVISNGLPLKEIAQAPATAPGDGDLRCGEPFILNAGRFEPQKDFETFIQALRLVASDRPVHALCCGDGSLRGQIERSIVDCGLVAEVRLSGYVSSLWSLMKRADVVVSTSLFEGSPNVVLEAMATGCPLVVSDIPTHRELLDEESAIFARPGDPRQFADGILSVLRDSDAAAKRASAARTRVQRYSTSAIAEKYIEVYRAILTPQRSVQHVAL